MSGPAGPARADPTAGARPARPTVDFGDVDFGDFGGVGGVGGIDLDDLLGGMFGRGRSGPIAGADQEAELPLSVEEAYRGGRRPITLDRDRRAPHLHRHDPAGGDRRAAHPARR